MFKCKKKPRSWLLMQLTSKGRLTSQKHTSGLLSSCGGVGGAEVLSSQYKCIIIRF